MAVKQTRVLYWFLKLLRKMNLPDNYPTYLNVITDGKGKVLFFVHFFEYILTT